jgi:Ca2+-transporting ATPase
MIEKASDYVTYASLNTDSMTLDKCPATKRLQLGTKLTQGFGAGGDPTVGESAAKESEEDIAELVHDANMVILTCGMGGGTGTGAIPVVAQICKNLGILTTGRTITGEELEKLTTEEYLAIADDIQVYARVKPKQKMRIVEALKSSGNIVAMTGDGVNDAPALKKASIGVAMGDGTDVAKESADMILENNDFATIVKAVKEGRKIYDNIKRFVKFQVSTNVGAILTIIGTSLLSLPLPFNPVQLLWLNIVMDGPPAQTLGIEGAEKDLMHRPPETGDILTKKTLIEILISGIVMAIGTIAVFSYQLSINSSESKAMTVAFTLFVMYQLFNAYNRKANSDKPSTYLYAAIVLSFLLQLLIIYLPQLQVIFRTTAISLIDWVVIIIVAFTIVIAERIMKRVIK